VLFGGGLIERRRLLAEFQVDRLAFDLVGPFEVRAMTLGSISVAGAGAFLTQSLNGIII